MKFVVYRAIIYENVKNETFSFRDFYSRRIRRIFPALLVVITATFLFGFFILSAFNKESNVDKKENVVSKQENIKKDFSQPISVQELLKTYK